LIGGEQSGFADPIFPLLLGQQLVVVLEDRLLRRALNL
jgi:hypothetical protein